MGGRREVNVRGRPCVSVCSREGQKTTEIGLVGGDVKKGPSHSTITPPTNAIGTGHATRKVAETLRVSRKSERFLWTGRGSGERDDRCCDLCKGTPTRHRGCAVRLPSYLALMIVIVTINYELRAPPPQLRAPPPQPRAPSLLPW